MAPFPSTNLSSLRNRLLIVLASVCLQTGCLVWLLTALGTLLPVNVLEGVSTGAVFMFPFFLFSKESILQ